MGKFEGKKFCAVGERDGIPGPAIAECLNSLGGEVVFITSECFV
ncbi:MAG: Glycine/sarcosine/betaine reductase complex component A1 [candidate division WS2 bacterium]|uniref:Glycine/sarcosine/betaine reductase complex component A1 n=1 Tax=Psychracetigena formicireducens TaxID=2986056 RepID=A0A9E2F415_PSYF1|nr:Glycine/sarcosine/betaine reductase complex component A1 [Candidatus Psychracetigena formicireducens]MBT9149839.1 Glycine/sarcosine/betaine reductase complex component A1 [Candidatus Psychracetigena formicireducens]